jgi:hypothetical protein
MIMLTAHKNASVANSLTLTLDDMERARFLLLDESPGAPWHVGLEDRNKVAAWVSSRHLRRSNQSRLAYQSPASGTGPGPVTRPAPMTASSFFVHRRTTSRS